MKAPPPAGISLDATITGLNEFGDGVFRHRVQTVKVARTIPGDRVRVVLPAGDKRFVYGHLTKLVKPSAQRVDSHCPAFEHGCGGCQWLHLDYAEQLTWKTRIIKDLFKQRCPLPIPIQATWGMAQPEAYRNKMSLRNCGGELAFMQEFDDTTIRPQQCRVQTVANQAVWKLLRPRRFGPELLQVHLRSAADGSVGVCLFVRQISADIRRLAQDLVDGDGPISGVGAVCRDDYQVLAGQAWIEHQAAGINFHIPLNGFFQTNYQQATLLLDLALEQMAINNSDSVLDLYCGSGFFSLPLARRAATVLGIENNAASVAAAVDNANRNGITNCQFSAADVATGLKKLQRRQFSAILLDPPRSGCEEAVLQELLRLEPKRLVYISCSPQSLVRDLKILTRGGFRAQSCQPIDMFPHSVHTETVLSLVRP